jgi:hypothetical protein
LPPITNPKSKIQSKIANHVIANRKSKQYRLLSRFFRFHPHKPIYPTYENSIHYAPLPRILQPGSSGNPGTKK